MLDDAPSQPQLAAALLAQMELSETVTDLLAEGIEPAAIAAALGATASDLITKLAGEKQVPFWFYTQAKLAHDLIHGQA